MTLMDELLDEMPCDIGTYRVQSFMAWLPEPVALLIQNNPGVAVAGGALRAHLAQVKHKRNEQVKDIDLFINGTKEKAAELAVTLGKIVRESRYAVTVQLHHGVDGDVVTDVQISANFKFQTLSELLEQFDFSVCQAAIWVPPIEIFGEKPKGRSEPFEARTGEHFDADLEDRALRFVQKKMPEDAEEVQELLERTIRYYCYGYTPAAPDYASSASPNDREWLREIDLWEKLKDKDSEMQSREYRLRSEQGGVINAVREECAKTLKEASERFAQEQKGKDEQIAAIKKRYEGDELLLERVRAKVELARIEAGHTPRPRPIGDGDSGTTGPLTITYVKV